MDYRPNMKHKTIKLLEVNIGGDLDNLRHDNDLLNITPTHESQKKKLITLTSLKLKASAPQKTMSKYDKTSHGLGERICKRHI